MFMLHTTMPAFRMSNIDAVKFINSFVTELFLSQRPVKSGK